MCDCDEKLYCAYCGGRLDGQTNQDLTREIEQLKTLSQNRADLIQQLNARLREFNVPEFERLKTENAYLVGENERLKTTVPAPRARCKRKEATDEDQAADLDR